MADTTLLTLFQDLVRSYDPTIDTSNGSSFRTNIIDPFLNRVGTSPLDSDLELFLVERLKVEYPTLDVSDFSGIRDLVIRPMKVLLEPLRREIAGVKLRQSIQNASLMTKDEFNVLLGNFFLSVRDGVKASGQIRVFFLAPQSVVIPTSASFFTDGGLEYKPVSSASISSAEMAFNFINGEYYFDIDIEAIQEGTIYNVGPGAITKVEGVPAVNRVSNQYSVKSGTNTETNEEAATRVRTSLTTRTLATKRGIRTVLTETFTDITSIKVVGFGEVEMERDIVVGPVSVSDVPGGVTNSNVDITSNIHIGGKTDVYVSTSNTLLSTDTLTIKNISDYGIPVQSKTTGLILNPPSLNVQTMTDVNGFFRDVVLSSGTHFLLIDDKEYEILNVTGDTLLTFDSSPGAISNPRTNIKYQIVKRPLDGTLKIPLTNLTAEDSNGNVVLNSSQVPVLATPGDPSLSAFLDSAGNTVALTENISESGNINLPVFRATSAVVTNSVSAVSKNIARSEQGFARVVSPILNGDAITKATGTVDYFLVAATNVMLSSAGITGPTLSFQVPKTIFKTAEGLEFTTKPFSNSVLAQPADIEWDVTTGSVDYILIQTVKAGLLSVGDWLVLKAAGTNITIADGIHLITSIDTATTITHNAVDYYKVTVRYEGAGSTTTPFTLTGTSSGVEYYMVTGLRGSSFTVDPVNGLFKASLEIEASQVGAAYNLDKDTQLIPTNAYVEGYKLGSIYRGNSFSGRDLPSLNLTHYIADMNTRIASTALDVVLTYEHANTLVPIQSFVEASDNRIVGEDILIKHCVPVYLTINISGKGLTATQGLTEINNFINSLSTEFEVSDLINHLYTKGATKISLPIEIVAIRYESNRDSILSLFENTLTIKSNEKFYVNANSSFTVET